MPEMVAVQRVVVIADAVLERSLLEEIGTMETIAHTSVYCSGKGGHAVMDDEFSGKSRVRIEILASAEVAADLVERLHESRWTRYSVFTFTDTVGLDYRDCRG